MNTNFITIDELVKKIKGGDLLIPEMQRGYVWTASQVRNLLDSLYRGYPTGSILVWETPAQVETRKAAISQAANPFAATRRLLLDGQQRLTSLAAVITGEPIEVRDRKKPIEILFNLNHPERLTAVMVEAEGQSDDEQQEPEVGERNLTERLNDLTFVVASKSLLNKAEWVRVADIFNPDKGDFDLVEGVCDDPRSPDYKKYTQRLQRVRNIRNYQYMMSVLEPSLEYDEVAEVFVRVNSQGTKLRGSDLALAQITSRWPGSLRQLEEFSEKCAEERQFKLDSGLLVKAVVVFATGQSRFRTVGTIPLEKLKSSWNEVQQGITFAIDFLKSRAQINDQDSLSSPFFLIPLAYYFVRRSSSPTSDESNSLRYWLHVGNARGHYSRGSSETVLDEDLRLIGRGAAPSELIEVLRRQVGRLEVEPADFARTGYQNTIFRAVYLALKAGGATDWQTGLGITSEFRYIFSKLSLSKEGHEASTMYEIANMEFLAGRISPNNSSKGPQSYLEDAIQRHTHSALERQCVPTDPELHKVESYQAFLQARRELLSNRVNQFFEQMRSGK